MHAQSLSQEPNITFLRYSLTTEKCKLKEEIALWLTTTQAVIILDQLTCGTQEGVAGSLQSLRTI